MLIKQLFTILFVLNFYTFSNAQQLKASLSAKQYYKSDSTTLVDFYFKINTQSLVKTNAIYQTEVLIFLELEGDSILPYADKFRISSKDNSTESIKKLIAKQSIVIKPNKYILNIQLTDLNNKENTTKKQFPFEIKDYSKSIISDVFIIDNISTLKKKNYFQKAGFEIIPKIENSNILFKGTDSLVQVYFEVYNYKEEKMFIETFIQKYGEDFPIQETYSLLKLNGNRNRKLLKYPLENLENGNYKYYIQVLDSNKKQLEFSTVNFSRVGGKKINLTTRNNKIKSLYRKRVITKYKLNNKKKIQELLIAIHKSGETTDRDIIPILQSRDLIEKQNWFFNYWEEKNPNSPSKSIAEFDARLDYIKTNLGGVRTDKARVFLIYGKPNAQEKEIWTPDSKPYEIWHYYDTKNGLKDKIFVFSTFGNSLDTRLIHSDADGEIFLNNWKSVINLKPGSNFSNRK